jgi:hypothetical protein
MFYLLDSVFCFLILAANLQNFVANCKFIVKFPTHSPRNRLKKALSGISAGDASEMPVICNPGLPQAAPNHV